MESLGWSDVSVRFGHRRIELRMNAQVVVNILNKKVIVHSGGWSRCKRIWKLLELDWEIRIQHTYPKRNLCVDLLIRGGCKMRYQYDYL
jgi:hypothetical protein